MNEHNGDSLRIRPAAAADAEALSSLYRQLRSPDSRATPERVARLVERLALYPDYHVYLALRGEEPVGTFALLIMDALGDRCAPAAVVEDVVVSERARGTGVGRRMMEFAMNRAREAECYKLVLSSNADRAGAHGFYESLGFRRHGFSFRVDL